MRDAKNSYYSIPQACVQDAAHDLLEVPDRQLARFRSSWATMRFFETPAEQLLLPMQGWLPGDPLMAFVMCRARATNSKVGPQ
eukprot:6950781-Pyramimonas_sp.AAC.1